jgi:hypothetical protein
MPKLEAKKVDALEGFCLNKVQGDLMQRLGYVSSNHWWASSALQQVYIPLQHKLLLLLKKHPYISRG